MMCKKPFRKENREFGCGQCTHCRINRSRLWVGRMLLESMEHPYSAFLTLTYNDANLPNPPHLSKKPLQLFIMRLREEIYPRKIRYFAVGEYGEKSWRPHYHLIVFGLSPTEGKTVEKCWPFGFIMSGTAEPQSMSYCCHYVVKKMTNSKDTRLDGRPPEFCLMSTRPGLGHGVVERMRKAYESERGQAAFSAEGWIAETFKTEGRGFPLGRYLKEKLYVALGIEKTDKLLHNQSVALDVYQKTAHLTASQIAAQRAAKLSQQNSNIRIRRRSL